MDLLLLIYVTERYANKLCRFGERKTEANNKRNYVDFSNARMRSDACNTHLLTSLFIHIALQARLVCVVFLLLLESIFF